MSFNLGRAKGTDGNGIKDIDKTNTVGLNDIYTITMDDDTEYTFIVTNGKDGEGGADIVTAWESTLSDSKVPSEKLTKDTLDTKQNISTLDTAIKQILYGNYNTTAETKFNYAIIRKTKNNITYEEFWILSNAYYDYTHNRFVKIDMTNTSFGIQIQANGTYPGEEGIDPHNTGINIWRNPRSSDVVKDTTIYDYTDYDTNHYIGAKRRSDNEWIDFGISSGWNNNLMTDSYGGITVGGNGIEIDGNGLFPFMRLTNSHYTYNNTTYYLNGILHNAYHPSGSSWNCDDNTHPAWFIGLRRTNNASGFVVMKNDMDSIDPSATGYTIHDMDMSDWDVIFDGSVTNSITNGDMRPVTSNAVYQAIGNIQEYVNR